MFLLVPEELAEYAPEIDSCDLSQVSAISLIANAQALAMGIHGSNRDLGLKQRTETFSLTDASIFLSHTPLVQDAVHPVTIKYRFPTDWQMHTATTDQYEVQSSGRLLLYLGDVPNFGRSSGFRARSLPYGRAGVQAWPRVRGEVDVTYWGGFDYSSCCDEVVELKAALGRIISLQASTMMALGNSAQGAGGVIEAEVDKQVLVKFDGSPEKKAIAAMQATTLGGSQSPLDAYLAVFRKYRAKVLPR